MEVKRNVISRLNVIPRLSKSGTGALLGVFSIFMYETPITDTDKKYVPIALKCGYADVVDNYRHRSAVN